jgi:hypothetical protein
LSDREARTLDINDLAFFEASEQHDFYSRLSVANATTRALCVDGEI